METNQKNIFHFFKTTNIHKTDNIKLEIPLTCFEKKNLMKCPFCVYQADKTSNYERHISKCKKKMIFSL